jgi:hypothetical protein
MAAETKHVIALVPEINEHYIQIKNTHHSCIYLTCILYFLNKLNLEMFSNFLLCEKLGVRLIRWRRVVTGHRIDDIVLGASSFYTANRPILAVAALRHRRYLQGC